jgi:hypothetical protein
MDEGVVEGSEDAGHAEDIFTCGRRSISGPFGFHELPQTFANLRTERDVLRSGALDLLFGRHFGGEDWEYATI